MAIKYNNIFDYIIGEENSYLTNPIDIDGWSWSMKEHVKTSFYYKYGRLLTGNTDDKPVKNIVRPILNLAYRAEDLDLKDILLYVDDEKLYHMSFLVKKYHDEVFVVENNIDEFLDESKEAKIDYGVALVQDMGKGKVQTIPLQSLAFCDQTNILSGPLAIKHQLSPDQLRDMEEKGWGSEKYGATGTIDQVIALAESYKVGDKYDGKQSKTPGKYIEVYEVHGTLPQSFLSEKLDDNKYVSQIQIVTFYQDSKGNRQGIILFRSKEPQQRFKVLLRDKVYGRACGFGGVEELFENQIWTTNNVIRMNDMLEAASKTILKTTDQNLAARHPSGMSGMDNLELLTLAPNTDVSQVDTFPRNLALFERSTQEWENHARQTGSAQEAIMGDEAPSGTPFKSIELQATENHSLHEYRKGKNAKFYEEVYRDWFIPHMVKEITSGKKFLAELTLEEMQYVSDCLVRNKSNEFKVKYVLSNGGEPPTPEMVEVYEQTIKEEFRKGGSKKFIEILKDELKDAPVKIKINIGGKQAQLAKNVDKLVNILRQIITAPQILDDPRMAKIFNQILEGSGLSPVDFSVKPQVPATALPVIKPEMATA